MMGRKALMGERGAHRTRRGALLALAPLVVLACGGHAVPEKSPAAPAETARSVENPALVQALAAREMNRPIQLQEKLVMQLNAATYLVALKAAPDTQPEATPGERATRAARGPVQFLIVTDEDGGRWLPLFTDPQNIRTWTTKEVRTLVREAPKAWSLALEGGAFVGVIINPGGEAVRLDRATLQLLNRLSGGAPPTPRDEL